MLEKFKRSKFWQGLVKLHNDMKPMTFSQKLEHLWEYYHDYLWLVGAAAIFICAGFTVLSHQSKETLVSGMMVNISIRQEGMDYLTTDYLEKLGGKSGRQVASLDYTNFSSLDDPTSSEDNYSAMQLLPARVSGKMLDYMILDKFAMEFYVNQAVYLDLREFFTADELEELGNDRLIYARQVDETDMWVVAVDITDTNFVQDNVIVKNGDRIYFALSGSTQRMEMCRETWEYINAWGTE